MNHAIEAFIPIALFLVTGGVAIAAMILRNQKRKILRQK